VTSPKVIAWQYLPSDLPVWKVAVVWLLMDRFEIGGAVAGVIWTVVSLMVVGIAVRFWIQKPSHPKDL
jgi:hypothetical protein